MLFVRTGGTSSEIGNDVGRAGAGVIREIVDRSLRRLKRVTGRGPDFFRRFVTANFLPPSGRAFPDYIEEIRSMADGARVRFEDLFIVNCEEELGDIFDLRARHRLGLSNRGDKCTSIAIRGRRFLLLGHNEDYEHHYLGRMTVISAEPNGLPAFLSLAYPGVLAGSACGLNAEGVAFGGNSLQFPLYRRGIPKNIILRHILAAKSLAHVERIMRFGPRATSGAVMAVSSDDDAAEFIETSPPEMEIGRLGPGGLLIHTNHVLSLAMDTRAERPTMSSFKRLAAARCSLRGKGGKAVDRDVFKALEAARQPTTLASILMRPSKREMIIIDRAPGGRRRTYRLK